MSDCCVAIDGLTFAWPGAQQPVLAIPQWSVNKGERVLVRGASGSGKSTLLSLIAGIHSASSGHIKVLDHDLGTLSQRQRDRLRANEIGYIFQQFNLLPYLSAQQNVELAVQFAPARRQRIAQRGQTVAEAATTLLNHLGLTRAQQQQSAQTLSVGQQQRVAAARALLGAPALIIADEPTSALDESHRNEFINLLFQECAEQGSTLLFVTHDATLATQFPQVVELSELNTAAQRGDADV
ncbi:ABC transporter ATP-binding protein [Pseudidiomarina aestuarii]|uniref:ABC transporter ATP-binding protein n=1 Tax=Pseudidiomarina aestuarii TaxID=624146 RepID=UPI003A973715